MTTTLESEILQRLTRIEAKLEQPLPCQEHERRLKALEDGDRRNKVVYGGIGLALGLLLGVTGTVVGFVASRVVWQWFGGQG